MLAGREPLPVAEVHTMIVIDAFVVFDWIVEYTPVYFMKEWGGKKSGLSVA